MAYYAYLDDNNKVVQVIAGIDETQTENLPEGFSSWEEWYGNHKGMTCKRTLNTLFNEHKEGGTPFRGNYAGIGYTYDTDNDVFYAPRPYPSWTINTDNWKWIAPVAYPDDGNYYVNEVQNNWEQPPNLSSE